MNSSRLDYLLHGYFDGQLSEAEKREFEELLLSDPRARQEFWLAARTHGALRLWGQEEWGRKAAKQPEAEPVALSRSSLLDVMGWVRRNFLYFLTPASVVVAVLLVIYSGGRREPKTAANSASNSRAANPPVAGRPAPVSAGIAVLKNVADVVWAKDAREYQPGDTLLPGWLRLRSGAVQIEFARGARVVLEGPAEFELVSSEEGYLKTGRLRAQAAEPSRGFRVRSATFAVVDHGTEFGCHVPAQGTAEVHVFKGSVEVSAQQTGQPARSLGANEAVAVASDGFRSIPVSGASFLSDQELALREQTDFSQRLANWRLNTRQISEQSNLLVHYTFENHATWERSLRNEARQAIPGTDASLVGCNWVQGRWPGKGAVEFVRNDDRIRVHVPGEFRALTYLAWVRVDSLPNHYSALTMTESLKVGEVHWALTPEGGLLLGARHAPPGSQDDWSSLTKTNVLTPERLGVWLMLASIYDTVNSTVTHFVNGQQLGQVKVDAPPSLSLGDIEIGNWGVRADDPRWTRLQQAGSLILNRSFKGRLDEFALFSTALSPEEIRAIYEFGKPASFAVQLAGSPEKTTTN
jgi:ferric-dicitrate binding protein FerR (iron transport regulator)